MSSLPDPADSPAPPPTTAAERYFGDRLPLVRRLADLLAGEAVLRGLIGPREAPRLWERHLLNCAVLGELLPHGASVADIGSGAGLPGLVLACSRPDLTITLVEPLQRRTAFLDQAVTALAVGGRVSVLQARAESPEARGQIAPARWITARAVAPLERLASWCAPALGVGGRLVAMKGARAQDEVRDATVALRKLNLALVEIAHCGVSVLDPPTTVVILERVR